MNYTTTDEHVPEAERNNRTIAERIRFAYHNLPYKALPKVMLRYLAMVSTKQLNLLPAKGGVSPYLSPHVILGGRNWDFNKHAKFHLELMFRHIRKMQQKIQTIRKQLMQSTYVLPIIFKEDMSLWISTQVELSPAHESGKFLSHPSS
ncbi:hypothetical protein [Acidithiobacillus sp.]|uniref:hypothetical protein n=1 Tax=Acidithiobacillus sp. TaxID=1872118 RepID=UPI003D085B5E